MNCRSCGYMNRPEAKYCAGCGTRTASPCPRCGADAPPDARFCDRCGSHLELVPEPQRPVPIHLAERIRRTGGNLSGERKQVTVMFADVKGSVDLTEQIDAEEWHAILGRFLDILTEGVHRFEGTVNQFTGDGIMALFGAPIGHEDHAVRACYAALHLRNVLGDYARSLRRDRGLGFSVRIGLNSGEVVVGRIGDDLTMEYTAVGHTVGLAQRMEQLAEPGRVYLTEHTAALVEGLFGLDDLGTFRVKGAAEPVRVHALEGLGQHRTRLDVARARGFSRFVGRRRELAALTEALERAEYGSGSVVGVVGEAGVGKSRLCHELTQRARASGMKVFEAQSVPYGRSMPFLPVLQLLRGYFGIDELDGPVAARQKIAGSLLLLDEGFRDALALVFDFLGVPDPDLPFPAVDPEARQRRLADVVAGLIHARSGRGPAVILIEDLHWIDEGSEIFLHRLVDTVPATRTLLVVNYRPEYAAAWMVDPAFQALTLQPLRPDELDELLDELLGTDPSLDALRKLLIERSSGNPFFGEELVRSLAASGILVGDRGAYRLGRALADVSIPPSIEAVLAARIDRLDPEQKQLLQIAAVIGRRFGETMLRRVADTPPDGLTPTLRELVAREFIQEEVPYPEAEYVFEHPLTHEVAYRSQLASRRSAVHAAVARAIADLDRDRLEERSALLAYHWEQAGDRLEAARWSRRAADWAGHHDPATAVRHWRKVRELLSMLPPSEDAESLRLASGIGLMNLGSRIGLSPDEARELFDEGRRVAGERSDNRSLARLLLVYARLRGQLGEIEEAVQLSGEAADVAARTGWSGLRLAACVNLSAWQWQVGRVAASLEVVDQAIADAPSNLQVGAEHLGFSPYVWLVMQRGRVLPFVGRCREAAEANQRALRLAREQEELEVLCWAHQSEVDLACITGDATAAITNARAAVSIADRLGTSVMRWSAGYVLGRALLMRREPAEARAALEQALGIIRDTRTGLHGEVVVLTALAEAEHQLGHPGRALETASEAVRLSRTHRQRPGGARGRIVLARLLRDAFDLADAASLLEEAADMLCREDARHLEPELKLEQAALAEARGDPAGAAELTRAAAELYESIGVPQRAARIVEPRSV